MAEVAELTPRSRGVDLTVKVVEKLDEREVTARASGRQHRVAEFLVGDKTGSIIMTLWDKDIDKVKVGKTYELKNAFVSTFKNSMRLNTGRYGSIEESDREVEANTSNNLSDKFVEQKPRRRRF